MPSDTFPVGARVRADYENSRSRTGRVTEAGAFEEVRVRWPGGDETHVSTSRLTRLPDDALAVHDYVGRVIRQCMDAGIIDYNITIGGREGVPVAHIVYTSSDGRTYRQPITEDSVVTA